MTVLWKFLKVSDTFFYLLQIVVATNSSSYKKFFSTVGTSCFPSISSQILLCDGYCISFRSPWLLFLVISFTSLVLIELLYFQSQCNSIGYRCCTALSSSDMSHLILAARTIPSAPLKSSIKIPNLHQFLFRSSPLMMTTSPFAKAGRFSFRHLMLYFSCNDSKYSPFHLFHALSLHFLTYVALFCRSPSNLLMSSFNLNVFSPNAMVFEVKTKNCTSSSK